MTERGRFAPTTSGPAHAGTLLAALLCWLDARASGSEIWLRLEDRDPERCTPEHADDLRQAFDWFGLDWDATSLQTERRLHYEAALDVLEVRGLLYPCGCSRKEVARTGVPAADGGFRYRGTCRHRSLPRGGWRQSEESLRLRLTDGLVTPLDEAGLDLSQDPAREMGDPVLLRRDGAVGYQLAVVVDDAGQGMTRVVRGRDLAVCTALHLVLQEALGLPSPTYRHHFLLLDERGGKLAKRHRAVGWENLAHHYDARQICGRLAAFAGLLPAAAAASPQELLSGFDWSRVRTTDLPLRWSEAEGLVDAGTNDR